MHRDASQQPTSWGILGVQQQVALQAGMYFSCFSGFSEPSKAAGCRAVASRQQEGAEATECTPSWHASARDPFMSKQMQQTSLCRAIHSRLQHTPAQT